MSKLADDEPDITRLAAWLKALAEPQRLRIMRLLMDGVQCNCELGDQLDMAPNLISHHLSVLRKAGLIDLERDPDDARWVYYSVNQAVLIQLTRIFGAFFDPSCIRMRRATCGPRRTESAAYPLEVSE